MGMSSGVWGERDLGKDSKFDQMLKIKLSCDEANISYPEEVREYFGSDVYEDEECIRRGKACIDISAAVSEGGGREAEDKWTVDVSKLPKECTRICFSNSW